MKAQRFFKGLSLLLLLNLLIKPVWIFLIDRQVQNTVGHQAYGTYFALFNLTYVLLFIADAGLSNMLSQRLAATATPSIRQLLKMKFALLLLYAVVCCFVAWLTHVAQWHILFYLILIQALNSLFLFLRSLLTANQLFTTDAWFSVLDKGLLVLLCAGPVYGLLQPITIELFLQLQLLSTSIAVGSLFFAATKKKLFRKGEVQTLNTVLKWISPFVLLILLMSAHNRLDAFLLERMHRNGAVQAGIYATAYRLLDAGNMIGYLTASFLVPFVARNRHDKKLVEQVLLLSRHGLLLFSAVAVAFVFVFAAPLQQLLYHTNDVYNNRIIQACMAVLPAYYLTHVYGSVLTATAQFKSFITVVLFAVLANGLLNLWLIPSYGAWGCCIATLLTQYGCGLALCVVCHRKLHLRVMSVAFLYYAISGLLAGLLFYFSKKLISNVWIILAFVVLIAFTLAITQRNSFKKLFSFVHK